MGRSSFFASAFVRWWTFGSSRSTSSPCSRLPPQPFSQGFRPVAVSGPRWTGSTRCPKPAPGSWVWRSSCGKSATRYRHRNSTSSPGRTTGRGTEWTRRRSRTRSGCNSVSGRDSRNSSPARARSSRRPTRPGVVGGRSVPSQAVMFNIAWAEHDGLHLVEPELRRHAADVGERHFRPRIPTGIAGRSSSVLPHPPRVAQRHDQCMLLAPRQQ